MKSRIFTKSVAVLSLLFGATGQAQQIKHHCFDGVGCWTFVRYGDYIDTYFTSDTDNPIASGAVVELGGEEHRFRISSNEPGEHYAGQFPFPTQSVVTWRFMLFAGTSRGEHDGEVVYELPFDAGTESRVTQAYDGPTTHQDEHFHSIDFAMSTGTPVHAARDGVVAMVVDGECADPAGTGCGNVRVDVRHSDGTYSSYQHLKPGSIAVMPKNSVEAGQFLALSGNSGKSAGPHLHFQVYVPTPDGEQIVESVPTTFRTVGGDEQLQRSTTYARPVSSTPSDVASNVSR